jgi:hypothetical protein
MRSGVKSHTAVVAAIASLAAILAGGAFAASVHGGAGRLTPNGRIGPLRLDHSRRQAVTGFAGRPDGVSNHPRGIQTLGYSCHRTGVGVPLGSTHVHCTTAFYLNKTAGKLFSFFTASSHYVGPHGVRSGMRSREAERRLHQRINVGDCGPYISLDTRRVRFDVNFKGGHRTRNGHYRGGRVADFLMLSGGVIC